MSIHREAMEHLDKARRLLDAGDVDSLRYAALEMRYCIEHLFYKVVPQYKDELPDNVLRGDVWKPGEIISMIADIDPGVTHDRRLRIGPETSPGIPATRMWEMGSQTGLRRDLARRLWNGLGFYLHARFDQRAHDPVKLRAKLEKVLPRLEQFRSDRVIMSGFEMRATSKCQDCGRALARRMAALKDDPYVVCPSKACGAVYKVTDVDARNAEWQMVQENLKCEKCGADNWLGVHALKRGAVNKSTVTCCGCQFVYQLNEYVLITEVSNAGENGPTG